MKSYLCLMLGAVGILFVGCAKKQQNDDVVSQRYVHKYGYAVAKDEFESRQYPGQVITLLRNGVTITATYENGVLHGPCTHTFPNSQTVETFYVYNQGKLVKETLYDVTGMPLREEVQLSPTRCSTTLWYSDGTPMSLEEYSNNELLEGQYFTVHNDLEAQVVKGKGKRVRRDNQGLLLYRDDIAEGYLTRRETFYANNSPESIAYYRDGKLHGEKKTFTIAGEPIAIKEYVAGVLHGKSTYFKNGSKHMEVHYLDGMKNGLEIHYLDGDVVCQEILWENDKKHGPSRYFIDGIAQTEYYYDNNKVDEAKWKELTHVENIILGVDSRGKR